MTFADRRLAKKLAIACAGITLFALLSEARSADDDLLAGADARIRAHRQADGVIRLLDAAGRPMPDAEIQVEQTRHAFLFGSNIFQWGRLPDRTMERAYRERFAELFNYATLGFYWAAYEPRQGEPRHEYAEQVARWCQEQGIATKGHPLAWNYADPVWLPDDAQTIRRLQMDRIDDCVSRFRGLIDRWDVVNEATHFDRQEFMLRRAPKHSAMWKQVGQLEFTRECFQHARMSGPQAVLLINDYRTDPAYERVVERLVDSDDRPLYDVIGIQSHMHRGPWSNRKAWEVCERFARFKVPLHFTETTILSGERTWEKPRGEPWPSTAEGEVYQAQEVVRFYTVLFSHPAVEAITWWDFSDYHAWQRAPAGFLRADMSPKPVYLALVKLIKDRWWTRTTLRTDPDGTARFRGFLGDYRLTVNAPDGQPIEATHALKKGQPNQWQVDVR